jgi:hypothetical protein
MRLTACFAVRSLWSEAKPPYISKAVREQWRVISQRAKWIVEKPQLRSEIASYDAKLQESWSDIHMTGRKCPFYAASALVANAGH